MKPQHFAALAGILLVIAVVLIATGKPAPGLPDGTAQSPEHIATVIGEGEIKVKPDRAILTFGITTYGASAADAEASNVASVRAVRDALIAGGVAEADVDVTGATLGQVTYQDFIGKVQVSGYKAYGRVTATIGNPARVQPLVNSALNAGATTLEGVGYAVEDPEPVRQQAAAKALENAAVRARALVRVEGAGLGELRSVEVLTQEGPDESASAGGLIYRAKVKATFEF